MAPSLAHARKTQVSNMLAIADDIGRATLELYGSYELTGGSSHT